MNETLKIDHSSWKKFLLSEMFTIKGSKTTLMKNLNKADSTTGYPYVSTQATNNGVRGFVDSYTEDGNILTVDSAVAGFCAYQDTPFSASDHVEKLIPNFAMDKHIALFLVSIINQEQYRYNYGRKCSQARLNRGWIRLPTTEEGNPDWQFMRNYIKSLPYSANLSQAPATFPRLQEPSNPETDDIPKTPINSRWKWLTNLMGSAGNP